MEYGLGHYYAPDRKYSSINGVLILLLMEYGLGPDKKGEYAAKFWVLILLLMEYGLGRGAVAVETTPAADVLILLLMEYGLGLPVGLMQVMLSSS